MMIMKKILNSFFVIIAAMVAFASCAKDEPAVSDDTKTVEFIAKSIDTKTHFGDRTDNGTYPTFWDNGDKVKVLLNLEQPSGIQKLETSVNVEISDDAKSARFKADLNNEYQFEDYTFYAVVPSTAYNAKSSAEGRFTVEIENEQTPLDGLVDKKAQVIYAISETTNSMPTSVQMNFKHYTAYGKLSLLNLTNKVSTVSSISLEFADTYLAGKWNYSVVNASKVVKEGVSKLTLNTTSTENLWFACAPVDVSNKELTLTVNTDKGPLVKKVTFPSERKFESGKVSIMNVDMAGIEPVEQGENTSYYEKVTSEPKDWSGKYLIVWGNNAHATLSGKDLISTASVTIVDDKITALDAVNAAAMTVTKSGSNYNMKYPDGKYFSVAKNSSSSSTTAFALTFAYTNSGVKISGVASEVTYILYSNNGNYYRCYTDKTGTNGYALPTLYKYVGNDDSGETPDPEQPTLTPRNLVFSSTTATATVGQAFTAPTLSGVTTGVTYSSLNTGVATVNNSGVVTIVAAGTTTITASAPATDEYESGEASYTLTVSAAQGGDSTGGYTLITDLSQITSGTYVIAAKVNNKYYAMSKTFASKINGVAVTVSNNAIAESAATNYVVTITKSASSYTIKSGSNYLKYGSSTNLGTQTSAYNWTIAKGTKGTFRFTSATSGRGLVFRAGTYNQFGGYALSNVTANGTEYYDVELFKLN